MIPNNYSNKASLMKAVVKSASYGCFNKQKYLLLSQKSYKRTAIAVINTRQQAALK